MAMRKSDVKARADFGQTSICSSDACSQSGVPIYWMRAHARVQCSDPVAAI